MATYERHEAITSYVEYLMPVVETTLWQDVLDFYAKASSDPSFRCGAFGPKVDMHTGHLVLSWGAVHRCPTTRVTDNMLTTLAATLVTMTNEQGQGAELYQFSPTSRFGEALTAVISAFENWDGDIELPACPECGATNTLPTGATRWFCQSCSHAWCEEGCHV